MDCVVTVPMKEWEDWLAEGALPGEPWDDSDSFYFWLSKQKPNIEPGERVYVVAYERLRGYAPLVRLHEDIRHKGDAFSGDDEMRLRYALVRRGGAVAVTIPDPIKGFRGFRYRWWPREIEVPFPEWETP